MNNKAIVFFTDMNTPLLSHSKSMKLTLLQKAIEQKDDFSTALQIAGFFDTNLELVQYRTQLKQLAEKCRPHVLSSSDPEQQMRQLVDCFYHHLAFSGNDKDYFHSQYSMLSYVIEYRAGIPVTLSVIFCEIASQLGLQVKGVNFPGHFLLRFDVDDRKALFVDPLNGQFLSWQELETLYFHILGELDEEQMPPEALDPSTTSEIAVRLLHNLKGAFIKEEKFQQALAGVDLLVQLCPDDPYERRDRGFLLHQLDCHLLAKADYQFFIDQCPQDPGAQLLKIQMRHLELPPVVLH